MSSEYPLWLTALAAFGLPFYLLIPIFIHHCYMMRKIEREHNEWQRKFEKDRTAWWGKRLHNSAVVAHHIADIGKKVSGSLLTRA